MQLALGLKLPGNTSDNFRLLLNSLHDVPHHVLEKKFLDLGAELTNTMAQLPSGAYPTMLSGVANIESVNSSHDTLDIHMRDGGIKRAVNTVAHAVMRKFEEYQATAAAITVRHKFIDAARTDVPANAQYSKPDFSTLSRAEQLARFAYLENKAATLIAHPGTPSAGDCRLLAEYRDLGFLLCTRQETAGGFDAISASIPAIDIDMPRGGAAGSYTPTSAILSKRPSDAAVHRQTPRAIQTNATIAHPLSAQQFLSARRRIQFGQPRRKEKGRRRILDNSQALAESELPPAGAFQSKSQCFQGAIRRPDRVGTAPGRSNAQDQILRRKTA